MLIYKYTDCLRLFARIYAPISPNEQWRPAMTQAPVPSQNALMMVHEGLWAAAAYAQTLEAHKTPIWDNPIFQARHDVQYASLNALVESLRKPFRHISREDVFDALSICCVGGPASGPDYVEFLEKLKAEGEAGEEVAAAFEILKTQGY